MLQVLSLVFCEEDYLATGSDDGSLCLWDTQTGLATLSIPAAHKTRIRALALVSPPSAELDAAAGAATGGPDAGAGASEAAAGPPAAAPASAEGAVRVASASSDGIVKVWELRASAAGDGSAAAVGGAAAGGGSAQSAPKPLAELATGARLTCLCSVPPQRKRKHVLKPERGAAAAAAQGEKKAKTGAPVWAGKRKEGAGAEASAPLVGKAKKRKGAEAKEEKGKGKGAKGKLEVDVSQQGLAHDGVVDFLDPEEVPAGLGGAVKGQGVSKAGKQKSKEFKQKGLGGQQAAGKERLSGGKVPGRQPVRGFISKKKSRSERR